MTLVLVTGAGASRNLGAGDAPMPLMPDWSNALCEALDAREPGLAAACQLAREASGPEFEENLGLLLRWAAVRHLEERFAGLGGPQPGSTFSPQNDARQNTSRRLDMVMEALNGTLYDQFGQRRVDDQRAQRAYDALLAELGKPQELVVATTNYDRSIEAALYGLGYAVDTGFTGPPGRTPVLDANGLVGRGQTVPVIHLHGAVGWYEQNGSVEDHYADQPYNPTLGRPVVLYPDPEKEPTSDATVDQLWREFREALIHAEGVLVLGHSLHDPALVRELRSAPLGGNIAVSFFDESDANRILEQLPNAKPLRMDFGPKPKLDRGALQTWLGQLPD